MNFNLGWKFTCKVTLVFIQKHLFTDVLQHSETLYNTLKHSATLWNTLQHSETLCSNYRKRLMMEFFFIKVATSFRKDFIKVSFLLNLWIFSEQHFSSTSDSFLGPNALWHFTTVLKTITWFLRLLFVSCASAALLK